MLARVGRGRWRRPSFLMLVRVVAAAVGAALVSRGARGLCRWVLRAAPRVETSPAEGRPPRSCLARVWLGPGSGSVSPERTSSRWLGLMAVVKGQSLGCSIRARETRQGEPGGSPLAIRWAGPPPGDSPPQVCTGVHLALRCDRVSRDHTAPPLPPVTGWAGHEDQCRDRGLQGSARVPTRVTQPCQGHVSTLSCCSGHAPGIRLRVPRRAGLITRTASRGEPWDSRVAQDSASPAPPGARCSRAPAPALSVWRCPPGAGRRLVPGSCRASGGPHARVLARGAPCPLCRRQPAALLAAAVWKGGILSVREPR